MQRANEKPKTEKINLKPPMGAKSTKTYSKIVIDIADYIFANPAEKMQSVLRKFAEICGKSPKTVERHYYKAQEYNKNRLSDANDAANNAIISRAVKDAENGLSSRSDCLEILMDIAKNGKRDCDKISAIRVVGAWEGWEAPTKSELTGKDGAPLIPREIRSSDEILSEIAELEKRMQI